MGTREGKKKETEIINALGDGIRKISKGAVLRLYDSYSVMRLGPRMIIPQQPVDMIAIFNDPIIEIKTSEFADGWNMMNLKDRKKQYEAIMLYGELDSPVKLFLILYSIHHSKYYLIPAKWLKPRYSISPMFLMWTEVEQFKYETLEDITKAVIALGKVCPHCGGDLSYGKIESS